MKRLLVISLAIIMTIGFAGCGKKNRGVAPAIVNTKEIQQEKIVETIDSTGRIIAEYYVDVVARVDGYLQKKFFHEGSLVKKGDLLFQIEPYTYAARVNEAAANLRNAQAAYRDSSKNLTRAEQLVKDDYISKADYDNKLALRDKDRAAVDSASAALTQAQINLGYTKIHSPISGKIGKIIITEGNYVTPSSGTLATIVSLDPIQVDFSLKSRSYLMLKKESKTEDLSDISVEITLADDTVYSQKGKIMFIDNTVDLTSGSVTVRAIFDNKESLLVPGDYVAVKITLDTPKDVILVPQEAVLESADGKYVYVIDKNKVASKRSIEVGEAYRGDWIVASGLEIGDVVATTGLQHIIEGQKIIFAEELKAQKAAKADIKNVGKPSFFTKVVRKIKRKIKGIMG